MACAGMVSRLRDAQRARGVILNVVVVDHKGLEARVGIGVPSAATQGWVRVIV